MHKDWAITAGNGTEAIFWSRAAEVFVPVEIDYSPETYRKNLENDGF
jgi:hypothetical protein